MALADLSVIDINLMTVMITNDVYIDVLSFSQL